MSIQIAAMPMVKNLSAAHEAPLPGSGVARPAQDKEKQAILRELEASLPGNRNAASINEANSRAAADLQQVSLAFNRKLKFEVDFDSKDIRIKVIDVDTDKVIKVLPPEELQRLHSRITETMGFLFDERA